MKGLRKTIRKKHRRTKRSQKRPSRRLRKRTSRRSPRRSPRRRSRSRSRRLMKGGMSREELNQYCATKQGLEKKLCEDLPGLLENHGSDLNDINSGDLDFLLDKWRDYITDHFEEIKHNFAFDDDDEDDEDDHDEDEDEDEGMTRLNNFLENKPLAFAVISQAYQEGLTGNWEPSQFGEVDDENERDPFQEWLDELNEMKRPTMK